MGRLRTVSNQPGDQHSLKGPDSLRSGLGLHLSPTPQQPFTALRSAGWLRVEGRRRTTTSIRQPSLNYDVGLLDSLKKHHRWQPARLPRTVVGEGCWLNNSQPPHRQQSADSRGQLSTDERVWRDQAHFAVIWVYISARHFSSPPLP